MKCDRCGENEANIKYVQIINGEKKRMYLCEKCGKELGINDMNFNMPIDFTSFLSDFFNEDIPSTNLLSGFTNTVNKLECSKCGLDFDDFMHTGKFGCSNCYEEFESRIDPILKNIHGANRHIGRLGKVIDGNNILKKENNENEKVDLVNNQVNKFDKLKEDLKTAIREERYEEAAKIRDEIKKEEK